MGKCLRLILPFVLVSSLAFGTEPDPDGFNRRGFIRNAGGQKCWYNQTFEKNNRYFMAPTDKHTTNHRLRTIEFENPHCMADKMDGLEGMESVNQKINKRMINGLIARWFDGTYTKRGADYDIDRLRPQGMFQKRGHCIQSKLYAIHGIYIDYTRKNNSITKVIYAPSIAGCGS